MELDKNKTKYFVIAIILLIILGVILIVHYNNKSMVSIEDDDTTTKKTTDITTTTTTKKVVINEVSTSSNIYKSTIDEETSILFNYKLTDEISDTDKLISKPVEIKDEFKNNNVIGLYDISLYDANMIKKSVTNSLITISIPITGSLVGYDEYKVVYIDSSNNITDEEFNTSVNENYITFDTTHLSLYGIIGIKKDNSNTVNLNNINVKIAFNGEKVEGNNIIYSTTTDTVDISVSGVDNYELYYGLKEADNELVYNKYSDNKIFKDVGTYKEVLLSIKVVVGNQSKTFDLNTFKVYDFIYFYDKNNPESPAYVSEETVNYLLMDITESSEEVSTDISNDNISKERIEIEGNTYIVDKADISDLEMKGTLYIDTAEQIDLGFVEIGEGLFVDSKELDRIVIMSKEFNLNGESYTYEISNGIITITRLKDDIELTIEPESEVTDEDISNENDINQEDSCEVLANPFDRNVNITYDEDENLVIEFEKFEDVNIDDNQSGDSPQDNNQE